MISLYHNLKTTLNITRILTVSLLFSGGSFLWLAISIPEMAGKCNEKQRVGYIDKELQKPRDAGRKKIMERTVMGL